MATLCARLTHCDPWHAIGTRCMPRLLISVSFTLLACRLLLIIFVVIIFSVLFFDFCFVFVGYLSKHATFGCRVAAVVSLRYAAGLLKCNQRRKLSQLCVNVYMCVAVCLRMRLLTIRRSCSKPPSKLCAAFVSNTRPSRHPLLSFTVPPSVRQTIVVVFVVIVGSYQLPVASCKYVAKTDACHCTKLATGLESHQQLLKESQMLLTCCCCCCCCRCCCE